MPGDSSRSLYGAWGGRGRLGDSRGNPQQRDVRLVMIELLTAQLHDVGATALVFHMARTALRGFDSLQAAVESAVRGDVLRYGLVAVQTQLPLAAAVAAVMTI